MYSKTLSVEDMCKRLRPIFGKRIDELYLKYTLMDSREGKLEIEQAINALYQKNLSESLLNDQVLLEPPRKEIIGGTYPLGTIVYGDRDLYTFGLREQDWMRHVCISGMSGSGKTTFAFQILANFIFKKKPFLVFDWKKSFRPLIKLSEKLRVFTVGDERVANFKLNINKPPKGVHPKEWINLLADIITEAYSASFGVHKMIVQAMDQAFTDFGVYAGSENYPTWYQLRDRLEEKASSIGRSRESEWLESALRIAYSLTFGNFGKSICYKGADDSDIISLYEHQTIMELSSLSNTEKKFFTQFILSYIYKYSKAGNVNATEEFKFAVVVDEAHNIFLKDKPNFISESIADVIFREIREYGVSLVTLDQHVSKLSDVVSGNSATNIAFQQMLPADIESISRLMQLQEHKDYFTKLPVGLAIVRLAERHHDPFIIKAPLMKLKSYALGEEELAEHMKLLLKTKKRKEVFEKSVKETELAKKIMHLTNISKSQGIEPNTQAFKEQIAFDEKENADLRQEIIDEAAADRLEKYNKAMEAAQGAQSKHDAKTKEGPAGIGLRNHKQQQIFEVVKKRLLNGEAAERVRKGYIIHEPESKTDVQWVFAYIEKKGFLEKWQKNHIANQEKKEEIQLTTEERTFLDLAIKNPELSISKLYALAELSPRKGNVIRQSLEEKGSILIEENKTTKGWTKTIRVLNH